MKAPCFTRRRDDAAMMDDKSINQLRGGVPENVGAQDSARNACNPFELGGALRRDLPLVFLKTFQIDVTDPKQLGGRA